MRAGSVRAVLLAVTVLAAGPAAAASTVQPPVIMGKYFEQNGTNVCLGSNACEIIFSSVPAGQTLTVQRVACEVQSRPYAVTSAELGVFTSATAGTQRSVPLAPVRIASETFSDIVHHFTGVYRDTRFPVRNATPGVRAVTTKADESSRIIIGCQISGVLSP